MVRRFSSADNRHFWERNEAAYFCDQVAPALLDVCRRFVGKRVLDVGAGSGSLVQCIRRRFRDTLVVGVDLAPKSPDLACAEISHLPFQDAAFDTVFCTEVLEHLDDEVLDAGLAELSRVLIPGGCLVMTTPYREDLAAETVTCPECGERFHRKGHQQSIDEQRAAGFLRAHGFEPLHLVPVKMRRLARFSLLARLFPVETFLRFPWRGRGTLRLLGIARKPRRTGAAGSGSPP